MTTYSGVEALGEVFEWGEGVSQANVFVVGVEEDTDDGLRRTRIVDHLKQIVFYYSVTLLIWRPIIFD